MASESDVAGMDDSPGPSPRRSWRPSVAFERSPAFWEERTPSQKRGKAGSKGKSSKRRKLSFDKHAERVEYQLSDPEVNVDGPTPIVVSAPAISPAVPKRPPPPAAKQVPAQSLQPTRSPVIPFPAVPGPSGVVLPSIRASPKLAQRGEGSISVTFQPSGNRRVTEDLFLPATPSPTREILQPDTPREPIPLLNLPFNQPTQPNQGPRFQPFPKPAQLDIGQFIQQNVQVPGSPQSVRSAAWDQYTDDEVASVASASSAKSATPTVNWQYIVKFVYDRGLAAPPQSAQASRCQVSALGESLGFEKKPRSLPPAPLITSCLQQSMQYCWGGPWETPNIQPAPAAAMVHPQAHRWVPDFRPAYHASPDLELRPARLSVNEREWAGSSLPPVDHSWLTDLEALCRAQLSCLSAMDWLMGIYFGSTSATQEQREVVRRYALHELQQSAAFGTSMLTATTLARRKSVVDRIGSRLPQSARDWLVMQPVSLRSSQGLFGPASASVPELLRQQQQQQQYQNWARPHHNMQRPHQQRRWSAPTATYTPSAAPQPATAPREHREHYTERRRSSAAQGSSRARRGGRKQRP